MASSWVEAAWVHDILKPVFSEKGQGTLTKWVIVAEVYDGTTKKLISLRGPNPDAIPIWDVKGMLYAVADDPDSFGDEGF